MSFHHPASSVRYTASRGQIYKEVRDQRMDNFITIHDIVWLIIGLIASPIVGLILNRLGWIPGRVRIWLKKQLFSEEMKRIEDLERRQNMTEEERRVERYFNSMGIQVPPSPIQPSPPE